MGLGSETAEVLAPYLHVMFLNPSTLVPSLIAHGHFAAFVRKRIICFIAILVLWVNIIFLVVLGVILVLC